MKRFAILLPLLTMAAAECGTLADTSGAGRDYLIGWYKLPNRHYRTRAVVPGPGTLIPVLKRDGGYYSISCGGEIPLIKCPEGLEWGLTNSSMRGTKIGLDAASKEPYIVIEDRNAQYEADISRSGEKQFMIKTNKPSGLLDPAAKPPQTKDDFVGCYLPVYLTAFRSIVSKGWIFTRDSDKYHLQMQVARKDKWIVEEEPTALEPLRDRLGFVLGRDREIKLVFNHGLKRYELLTERDGNNLRIPLVRVSRSVPPETGAGHAPIGIPAWH